MTPSNVRKRARLFFTTRPFISKFWVLTLRVLTVWDLRSFKKPVSVKSEMTTLYPQTNAIFSPDDKYVVTGVGTNSKGGHGKLLFMNKNSLEVVKELAVDSTPVKVVWHSKINQVSWMILSLWGLLLSIDRNEKHTSRPLSYPLGFWRADLNFFLPPHWLCDNQDRSRII